MGKTGNAWEKPQYHFVLVARPSGLHLKVLHLRLDYMCFEVAISGNVPEGHITINVINNIIVLDWSYIFARNGSLQDVANAR